MLNSNLWSHTIIVAVLVVLRNREERGVREEDVTEALVLYSSFLADAYNMTQLAVLVALGQVNRRFMQHRLKFAMLELRHDFARVLSVLVDGSGACAQ
jgi:hypothetical protein